MESFQVGGGDVESRTKAQHRGRAYQCLHCLKKPGKRVIDIRCRLEDHIFKMHLSLSDVPFYCRLCLFRCKKREQLLSHITGYPQHVQMATLRGVTNHAEFLHENTDPYVIALNIDYAVLSVEESIAHFMAQAAKRSKLASSLPPTFQSEGIDGSVINQSRLVSPAPASIQSNTLAPNTLTLDENCMSRLMEDVRNFLQQSPLQATPLDTTQRLQNVDNAGYLVSPTMQKPSLMSNSMIMTSPLLGGSSGVTIKPKAVPQATPTYLEGSTDMRSSPFVPITQPGTSQMGSQTSIASIPITVTDGISDTVQEDLMKQLLPPAEEMTLDPVDTNQTVVKKRPASTLEESESPVQSTKRPKLKPEETHPQQQPVSPPGVPEVQRATTSTSAIESPLPTIKRPKFKKVVKKPQSGAGRVALIAEQTLLSTLQQLKTTMDSSVKAVERVEKIIIDNNCLMSKMIGTMQHLANTIEDRDKEERRREERLREMERNRLQEWRREEDRRREERRREDETRREERRREAEQRDREERRKANERRSRSRERREDKKVEKSKKEKNILGKTDKENKRH